MTPASCNRLVTGLISLPTAIADSELLAYERCQYKSIGDELIGKPDAQKRD